MHSGLLPEDATKRFVGIVYFMKKIHLIKYLIYVYSPLTSAKSASSPPVSGLPTETLQYLDDKHMSLYESFRQNFHGNETFANSRISEKISRRQTFLRKFSRKINVCLER